MSEQPTKVNVAVIFGYHTQQGIIELTIGEGKVQLPPDKAATIGRWLIEAGEAARHDEAMMKVLAEIGLEEREKAMFLQSVRRERAGDKDEEDEDAPAGD